jgi:hypothetical protein
MRARRQICIPEGICATGLFGQKSATLPMKKQTGLTKNPESKGAPPLRISIVIIYSTYAELKNELLIDFSESLLFI